MTKIVKLSNIYITPVSEGALRDRSQSDLDVIERAISIQAIGLTNICKVFLAGPEATHGCKYVAIDGAGRFSSLNLIHSIAMDEVEPIDVDGVLLDGHLMEQPIYNGDVEVVIDKNTLSKSELLAMQFQNNFLGLKTQSKDGINALQLIWNDNPEFTIEQLAQYVNMKVSQIKKLFKTVSLPNYAREALTEGKISLNNAVLLTKLSSMDDVILESIFDDSLITKADGNKGLTTAELAQKISMLQQEQTDRAAEAIASVITPTEKVFIPKVKVMNKGEIVKELEKAYSLVKELSEAGKDIRDASSSLETLKLICGIDPQSVEEQEVKYNKDLEVAANLKRAKAANRENRGILASFWDLIEVKKVLTIKEVPESIREDYQKFSDELSDASNEPG